MDSQPTSGGWRDGSVWSSHGKEQLPICRVPQYLGEPGASSLRYDTDLVHTKPATDVILHGQAYAPNGEPVDDLLVAMRVGPLRKGLRVVGDREWGKGLFSNVRLGPPKRFATMPLVYERTFGGTIRGPSAAEGDLCDRRNPIGRGFAHSARDLVGTLAPNVEYLDDPAHSARNRPRTAGFGPIPPSWSPRLERAGTYDETWEAERRPLAPADFDDRHYQCAPDDQQAVLHGGEEVVLHNLSAGGQMRFVLPRVALGLYTRFAAGAEPHGAKLHTVILEPEGKRVILVWQSALACRSVYELLSTTVFEKRRI